MVINRKRVRRLMRVMGLEAIYQKPNTSQGQPDNKVYPYLLRGLIIDRPNQVWCADITYIPMAKGFVYLVAVMDWFSRRVLSWRLSITMEADFCVEAVQEAMAKHGRPTIFNTDQGVQFTSAAFLDELETAGVRISMDGKGRFLDNIFIERLWRSLKYEEVFIKAYGSVLEARRGIGGWLSFYNEERPHQALGYRTPRAVFAGEAGVLTTQISPRIGRGTGNTAGRSLKSPRFLSSRWGPPQTAVSAELSARPRRRTFTAADKLRILADIDRAAQTGGIGVVVPRMLFGEVSCG